MVPAVAVARGPVHQPFPISSRRGTFWILCLADGRQPRQLGPLMVALRRLGGDARVRAAGPCFSVSAVALELLLEGALRIPEITRHRR
jgi:hypothetical protein